MGIPAAPQQLSAAALWPDESEDTGRARLRRTLHQLQSSLPSTAPDRPWLLVTPTTIKWNPAADYWLDVLEFERLSTILEQLAQAVALYAGDLLPGCYDDWVIAPRERLRELYVADLDRLVEEHRARLDYKQAALYARQLLAHDPLSEVGIRQLLAVLYELGDRTAALVAYERFTVHLVAELGVEPMPETVSLYEAVLHQRSLPGTVTAMTTAPPTGMRGAALLPLVGREREMAVLTQAWVSAAHGRGELALITGEAGIGKTRLTAELARMVEANGGRVMRGGATFAESTPYQAIVTALRSALPLLTASAQPGQLRALLPLIPELGVRHPDLRPLPPIEPERERTRLYQALGECLTQLAEPRPLLLILEDLHWAGAATIDFLSYLMRATAAARVLIVATYREEETSRQHPLRELRREFQQEGRITHLGLTRLDQDAVVALAQQVVSAPPDVAQQLYAESEGNPFFLSELVREMLAHDSATEATSLPPARSLAGVQALINARIARLALNTRLIAEVAAVAGVTFNLELVGEVAGWDEGQTLTALDELLDQGLIRDAGARSGYDFVFSHHLIQDSIYAALDPGVRARRHRRTALVLEDLHPGREELASELARHFDLGAEADRAAPYYLRSAHQALAVYADEEALAAATRGYELSSDPGIQFAALALAEGIHQRSGEREPQRTTLGRMEEIASELDDDDMVCEVLRRKVLLHDVLGKREEEATMISALKQRAADSGSNRWQAVALQAEATLQHHLSQYDAARTSAEAAANLYRQLGDIGSQVECYCLLAECYIYQAQYNDGQALIKQAIELAPTSNTALLIRTLKTAATVATLQREYHTGYQLANQMLALCHSIFDREGEADAHFQLARAGGWLMQVEEAFAHFDLAKALYTVLGNQLGEAQTLLSSGNLLGRLGRHDQAITAHERAEALFAQLGNTRGQVVVLSNLAVSHSIRYDHASAKAAALRGLTLVGPINSPEQEATLLAELACAELELGENAAVEHYEAALALRHIAAQPGRVCITLSDLAAAYLRTGNLMAAKAACNEALARYRSDAQYIEQPEHISWTAARINHALGNEEATRTHMEEAHAVLERKLATFPDEAARVDYRQQDFIRDLLAAYERDEWPAYAQPRSSAPAEDSTLTPACPTCGQADAVVKAGLRHSGSQRYRCQHCQRYFTPQPHERGHSDELRERAFALYHQGRSKRAIARELDISPQTVSNWLAAASARGDQ